MPNDYTTKVREWSDRFQQVNNVDQAWVFIEKHKVNVIWSWAPHNGGTMIGGRGVVNGFTLVHRSGKIATWSGTPTTMDWDPVVCLPEACNALQLQLFPPPVPPTVIEPLPENVLVRSVSDRMREQQAGIPDGLKADRDYERRTRRNDAR